MIAFTLGFAILLLVLMMAVTVNISRQNGEGDDRGGKRQGAVVKWVLFGYMVGGGLLIFLMLASH